MRDNAINLNADFNFFCKLSSFLIIISFFPVSVGKIYAVDLNFPLRDEYSLSQQNPFCLMVESSPKVEVLGLEDQDDMRKGKLLSELTLKQNDQFSQIQKNICEAEYFQGFFSYCFRLLSTIGLYPAQDTHPISQMNLKLSLSSGINKIEVNENEPLLFEEVKNKDRHISVLRGGLRKNNLVKLFMILLISQTEKVNSLYWYRDFSTKTVKYRDRILSLSRSSTNYMKTPITNSQYYFSYYSSNTENIKLLSHQIKKTSLGMTEKELNGPFSCRHISGDFPVRRNARIVLVNSQNEVLLMKISHHSGKKLWFTIGGGIGDGEAAEFAVRRELEEETGIKDASLKIDPVWYGENLLKRKGIDTLDQNLFFFGRVISPDIDITSWQKDEKDIIEEIKWCSLDELRTTVDLVSPPDLVSLLEPLLKGDFPQVPFNISLNLPDENSSSISLK